MSVVYFLLLVGLLVSIHELGHFLAAKALDVGVLKFSLGFGPALARLQRRETEYRIGLLPLGGYVRLLGEDPTDSIDEPDRSRSFMSKPLWRRLVVVFAGPAANLLCPVVIYFALFAGHTELPAAVIGDVLAEGPAAAADIRQGDQILEINGRGIRYWEDLEEVVGSHVDQVLRLRIKRAAHEFFTYITPRRRVMRGRDGMRSEQGLIGVTQAPFRPQVGVLDSASPAARAGLRTGDLIVSVDGLRVASWTELAQALQQHNRRAAIAFLRPRRSNLGFTSVRLLEPGFADLVPDVSPGPDGRNIVETGLLSSEFFVASVEAGSPAEAAGLRPGDVIVSLDDAPVSHWLVFDQALQANPTRAWRIGWLRSNPGGGVERLSASVTQVRKLAIDEFGHEHQVLVFGASNDFPLGNGEMVPIEGRFLYAASHAVGRTVDTVTEMARGFWALLDGTMPRGVGGPIMMYRIASVSGAKGWDSFLLMLALVSINLGLINLLPIPMLDGGHLMIAALEVVGKRRLSPRVRDAVTAIGLALIVSLTLLALRNDVVRYLLQRSGDR